MPGRPAPRNRMLDERRTIDNLQAVELATTDGRIVRASESVG